MLSSVWRHLAIAFSRKFLASGGFRKAKMCEDNAIDKQACHSSLTAGAIYGRSKGNAPGVIEAMCREYRNISQEWHAFLGLGPSHEEWEKKWQEEQQAIRAQRKRKRVNLGGP